MSVIIPAYNAEETITETLQSIKNQSYTNLEIIVVDDGSEDNTAAIVKSSFPEVTYIYQRNSGGCAVPRNTGIASARGELICFFDADDLMLPERIEMQVEQILNHTGLGMVFCNYQNFSQNGLSCTTHFETCSELSQRLLNKKSSVISDACSLLLKENFGSAGSILVRRDLVEQVGGFSQNLKACEDFHLYYRIARLCPVVVLKEVGFLRRVHESNMSGDLIRMLKNYIASRSLLYADERCTENRRLLARFVADKYAALAWIMTSRREFYIATKSIISALKWDPRPGRVMQVLREFVRIVYYIL